MSKYKCKCGGTFELTKDTFQSYTGVREPIYLCPKCYTWMPADVEEVIGHSIGFLESVSVEIDNQEVYNNLLKVLNELIITTETKCECGGTFRRIDTIKHNFSETYSTLYACRKCGLWWMKETKKEE